MKFFADELSPIPWSVLNHIFLGSFYHGSYSPSEKNLHENLQMIHRVRKLIASVHGNRSFGEIVSVILHLCISRMWCISMCLRFYVVPIFFFSHSIHKDDNF